MGSFPDIYNDPHSWPTISRHRLSRTCALNAPSSYFKDKPIAKGIKRLMADNSGDNNWKTLLEMAKSCPRPLDRGSRLIKF